MEIKQKSKITNILKIIVFTLILLISILVLQNHTYADSQLFYENIESLWHGIPHNGEIDGKKVWCSDYGRLVDKWLTADGRFQTALNARKTTREYINIVCMLRGTGFSTLDFDEPGNKLFYSSLGQVFWKYANDSTHGLINPSDYYALRNAAIDAYATAKDSVKYPYSANNNKLMQFTENSDSYGLTYGNFEDQYVSANEHDWGNTSTYTNVHYQYGLIGQGNEIPYVLSTEYKNVGTVAGSSIQAALYVATAPQDKNGKLGYTPETIQRALWGTNDSYNEGQKRGGNGLSTIANLYNTLYKKLQELIKKYGSVGEAYLKSIKSTAGTYQEKGVEIEGGKYDLYTYDKYVWNVNKSDQSYILGPFAIDYSVIGNKNYIIDSSTKQVKDNEVSTRGVWRDDGTPSGSWKPSNSDDEKTGWLGIYFNYIRNVTVYNQNKKNIKELGGRFEILDENGKVIFDGSNKEGLQDLQPGQPFYIKVYRGSMKAEDFTNFYAKFDFKYLYEVAGYGTRYHSEVYKWYWSEKKGQDYYLEWSGTWDKYCRYKKYYYKCNCKNCNEEESNCSKNCIKSYTSSKVCSCQSSKWLGTYKDSTYKVGTYTVTHSGSIPTYIYELQKESMGDLAQKQTDLVGERHWNESSIVITTKFEPQDLEVDIEKICSETGKPLYGAEFNIKLDIQGTDAFGNTINKQLEFTRTTDSDGIARLPREEIEAMGVDLSTFRGTINVTAKETYAPAGHTVTQEIYTGTINNSSTLKITAKDNEGQGVIKLAKIDKNGQYIDADFEVVVIEEGKDYPSIQNCKIKGSTENGVMYITREDLRTVGIEDIDNFTGNLVLEIVEVKTKNGYSIRGQGKTVTLRFEKGELKEYNETDGSLTVEYLYEDALPQALTDYVEGKKTLEELPEWVRNNIQEWINKQLAREDLDMEYNEVMDWFKQYVEEHKDEIFKVMTESSSKIDQGMLQITVENDQGMELPNIPTTPPPPPDDLTMRVAGYAFLDGTETKGQAIATNGELDPGEILLRGIKVTLKEKGGATATLIQSSKGEDIRTNPTITNENGYYEFRGVDPLKDYYVEFEYNGMKYEASPGKVEVYNSDKWAVTAKATENNTSARNKYKTITPQTTVYSYEELEGIYNAIETYTLSCIMREKRYPSDSEIRSNVKQYLNSGEMNDIDARLDYVLSGSVVTARAGYGAGNSGTYPHETRKEFLMNRELVNMDKETYEFMNKEINRLYPGQLQIHLGLKERDRTDLSLTKDIVESELDINGHKTTYKYENGDSNYTEYIYEEDYRYDEKEKQNTNIAYYDDIKKEQEPELYITYKITVTNEMTRSTNILEIVDYFDPNFEVVGAWRMEGDKAVTVEAGGSKYGGSKGTGNEGYASIYLTPNIPLSGNTTEIYLKLKLKDAKNNISKYIKTEKGESKVSKAWEIENFAEINAYYTDDAYIDIDSHPGNFSISNYKKALNDYQQAFSDFMNSMSESAGLAAQAARDRLLEVREDDAWEVSLTLVNNGLKRELNGSAWEAISDEIKTASNLQNTDTILQYIQNNGVEGITVELVELRDFGTEAGKGVDIGDEKVRARTTTDSKGNYHFESYIPGNYVVRFTYGDKNSPIRSKLTKDSEGKYLQVNGQFYQSTKANPKTDAQEYWYADNVGTRYSDAQDGAQARAKQIEAEIKGSRESKSNSYNYTGVVSIDSGIHQDAINAYTSSIHAEGEYTKQVIEKAYSKTNTDYAYEIENVDFGITPRAGVDLQIDKYVSNIKVYLQNKTLQLDCSFEYEEDEEGNKRIKADGVHYNKTPETENLVNLVIANYGSNSFLDGLIEVLMDDQLYNGAQLEVTYTISVDNKSEYDTLRWVINNGTKVGVVYYENEDYTKLPNYEQGKVIYHNDAEQKFTKTTGTITPDSERVVKTSAINIVDYVEPNLQFRKTNFLGEAINQDWTDTNKDEFISSRKDYGNVMSGYSEAVKSDYDKLTNVYNQYIKAADGSKLLDKLDPRNLDGTRTDEKSYRETTLTLVTTLGTTASDTNDYEYHNLIEIVHMGNTAGRVKKVEYYDVDGKVTSTDRYTEEERKKTEDKIPYLPTIGTSKSETVVFHAPTGLQVREKAQTYVTIALVALVTLAGGIVLIKKYAVKTKQE